MEYVCCPQSRETQYLPCTECTNCSKMFACDSRSWAGLTRSTPDTVDIASRLTPTNAVRQSTNHVSFQLLISSPPSVRSLQDRKSHSVIRNPHTSENEGQFKRKDGYNSAERYDSYSAMNTHSKPNETPRFAPPRTRPPHQHSDGW